MQDTLTPAALKWLSTHHGIITAQQLRQCGVTARTMLRLVAAGVLLRVAKGVYRIASTPTSIESSSVTLSVAHPVGFVTGPTGAKLTGLRRQRNSPDIHYCVPHGHELKLPGVRLRQSRNIDTEVDIRVRADGIRIASPARLAFDLAADLSDIDHRSVVEQLLHDKHCKLTDLAAVGKRLVAVHRPGSARFMRTMESRLPGGPLESHPEVVLAQGLRDRGVPLHGQATWLDLPGGRRIRLDLSVPDVRWGVEVDVHFSHFLLEGSTADKDRDRKCRRIGWQVDRVTQIDLLDLDTIVAELVELYELRCAELGQIA